METTLFNIPTKKQVRRAKGFLNSSEDYFFNLKKTREIMVREFAKINATFLSNGGDANDKKATLQDFKDNNFEQMMDKGKVGGIWSLFLQSNPDKKILLKTHYIESNFERKPNICFSGAQMFKLYGNDKEKILNSVYTKHVLYNLHFLLFTEKVFSIVRMEEIPLKNWRLHAKNQKYWDNMSPVGFSPKMKYFKYLESELNKYL